MNTKLPINVAAKVLGVSLDTVRRWEKRGIIKSIRTPGGHRRYDISEVDYTKNRKKIRILETIVIKIIGKSLIPSKPSLVGRLVSFVIISYSLIFIALNPTVLADEIKSTFSKTGQVLGVSSTGGSNVTFASTLDSNFNLAIKGVINTGGISNVNYNAFATSGQSATKTSVISSSNDLYVGGDLEVAGTINPTGFLPGSIPYIGSTGALTQDNSNFYFDPTSKNFGIGTNVPGVKLQISNNTTSTALRITRSSDGSYPADMAFTPAAGISSSNVQWNVGMPPNTNDFYIRSYDGSTLNPVIVAKNTGNVGIGTSNATQNLHVVGGVDATVEVDGTAFATGPSFKAINTTGGSNTFMAIEASGGIGRLHTSNALMSFSTSSGEVGRWNGANLGIGTTAAAAKLDIAGSGTNTDFRISRVGNTAAYLSITSQGGAYNSSNFAVGGTDVLSLQAVTGGTALGSYSGGATQAPSNGLIVSGNVGIGTSSPAAKLQSLATTEQLRLSYDTSNYTAFTVGGTGNLTISPTGTTLNIGDGTNGYITTFSGKTGTSNNISLDNGTDANPDLTLSSLADRYLNLTNSGAGTMGMTVEGAVTIGSNTTPVGKLDVSGAITGKALAMFNETGNQAIFTASASGVAKFTVQHSGLVDATADGSSTKVVAGAIVDGSYTGTGVDGLMGVDSSDGRFYFRYGGAWHYVAQTAGFQIPNYETFAYDFDTKSFDTTKPLADGDFLVPFAEKRMSDGAVHGLYARIKDVADKIFKDVQLVVNSLLTNKIVIANTNDSTKSTIGVGKVLSGTKEINISNENINDKSLIYITPTTSTSNHTIYIKAQGNGSFTVGFDDISDKDVSFNWWIVEAQK